MSKKKIFDNINTTTVVLAISCIILLVSLIVAVAYWNVSNAAYNTLQSQNSAYVNDHSHSNQDYESLKSQFLNDENQLSTSNNQSVVSKLLSLQSQLKNATSLADLQNVTDLAYDQNFTQGANSYSQYSFLINFSGCIYVTVYSSSPDMYVEVSWSFSSISSFHPINYDNTVTIGTYGIVGFPVLPSTVQIRVGNTNLANGATGTVYISYTC